MISKEKKSLFFSNGGQIGAGPMRFHNQREVVGERLCGGVHVRHRRFKSPVKAAEVVELWCVCVCV